jgi:hypothetical protein
MSDRTDKITQLIEAIMCAVVPLDPNDADLLTALGLLAVETVGCWTEGDRAKMLSVIKLFTKDLSRHISALSEDDIASYQTGDDRQIVH